MIISADCADAVDFGVLSGAPLDFCWCLRGGDSMDAGRIIFWGLAPVCLVRGCRLGVR